MALDQADAPSTLPSARTSGPILVNGLRHEMSGVAGRVAHPVAIVVGMALALLLPLPFLDDVGYASSGDLHAALEVVGGLLAVVAGITFLSRFLVLGDRVHFVFGLAFVANGAADLVHGWLPYADLRGWLLIPTTIVERGVPATFVGGRSVMVFLLLLAPLLAGRVADDARRRTALVWSVGVAASVAVLTVLAFFAQDVTTVVEGQALARPVDLVVGVLFAAAAVILLRWHLRTRDRMTWWVALSVAVGAVGQLAVSFAGRLYGPFFDLAHGYKVISYLLPLLGLSLFQVAVIAERNRYAAALEEADETKNEFVSVVSHELRTPLTAILGFSSLMNDEWDITPEEEKRHFITVIDRQAERLSRLVNDLLAMSRLEAGRLDTRLENLPLDRQVRRAIDGLGERGGTVQVDIPEELTVRADPDHLEQIVVNYVSNAVKYGRPPVVVRARDIGGGFVDLTVTDEGDGVPEAFVEELFEKFTQADMGTTRSATGTGLGLAIVRGLAVAQGGEAWYEPNRPTGACFHVRLRLGGDD